MPKIAIKCVDVEAELLLFDLSGTLIDDRAQFQSLAKARMRAFTDKTDTEVAKTWADLEGVDPETLEVDMDGPLSKAPRSEDLAVATLALYRHGHPWHEAKKQAQEIYYEADTIQRATYRPLFIGCLRPALEALKARGFKLGVATNSQSQTVLDVLKSLDAETLFEVVVGTDMVVESKPAPDMILESCTLTGVEPLQTVYFGDQPTDMEAGRNANIAYVVGVGGADLMDAGADAVVASVAELVHSS